MRRIRRLRIDMIIYLYLANFFRVNVLGAFEAVVRGTRDDGMEEEDGCGRGDGLKAIFT